MKMNQWALIAAVFLASPAVANAQVSNTVLEPQTISSTRSLPQGVAVTCRLASNTNWDALKLQWAGTNINYSSSTRMRLGGITYQAHCPSNAVPVGGLSWSCAPVVIDHLSSAASYPINNSGVQITTPAIDCANQTRIVNVGTSKAISAISGCAYKSGSAAGTVNFSIINQGNYLQKVATSTGPVVPNTYVNGDTFPESCVPYSLTGGVCTNCEGQ
jgi:hypothetical protein